MRCQRESFDIPRDVAYLNAAYMGPLSTRVVTAGSTGLARKMHPWTIASDDFFEPVENARRLFARLVDADTDGVAILPAVSYGIAIAAQNVRISAGQTIVVLAEQFPSNVYSWMDLADRYQGELITVERPDDHDWTRSVLDRIDERATVVSLETCHWTDGGWLDLALIGERVRDVGATFIVDGTQSIGAVPFDIDVVRPDFLITALYKWLLAPYGAAMMWCSDRYRDGRPLEFSWITRRGSGDFAHLVDYQRDLRRGARRYDVGQTSDFAMIPAITAALEQALDWGVAEVCSYATELSERIAERAKSLGLGVAPRHLRAPHLLGVHLEGADPEVVAQALAAAQVYVSVRGEAMRVSSHVFNDGEDVDRLFEALEAAL
jgi:selenocysteine lyase/cysteine desulfurase